MDQYENLIGAYALGALDEEERRDFERHLAVCGSCRSELRAYHDAVASLAYAAPLADPPAGLRARIVDQARAESTLHAPAASRRQRRRRLITFAAPAAVALAAAAVAIFVVVGHGSSSDWVRTATDRIALSGGKGVVVVSGQRGALLTSLADAPAGRTYEAWVIRGRTPTPAGTFDSGGGPFVLAAPVRHGDVVAVTVEPAGGSTAPTSKPILSARV